MSANFRFVVHAAQCQPHEFTAHSPCDGFSQGRFADARRPNEAKDRPLHARLQFLHRQVVQNPFLYLFQVVVVLVQDVLRFPNVDVFRFRSGGFRPRQRGHPFQVGARDHVFRRSRSHFCQTLQFALAFLFSFRGHSGFFDLLAKFVDFRLAVVVFA